MTVEIVEAGLGAGHVLVVGMAVIVELVVESVVFGVELGVKDVSEPVAEDNAKVVDDTKEYRQPLRIS